MTEINVYKLLHTEFVIYVDGEKEIRRDSYELGHYLVKLMDEHNNIDASITHVDISGDECTPNEEDFIAKF